MSLSTMRHPYVRADDVLGIKVQNTHGDDLGKIETIVVDQVRGDIAYAVLSFGGFLGMGDKLFAIPWSTIQWDRDSDCAVLPIDKEALKAAPGFDKENWPSHPEYYTEVRRYYSTHTRF